MSASLKSAWASPLLVCLAVSIAVCGQVAAAEGTSHQVPAKSSGQRITPPASQPGTEGRPQDQFGFSVSLDGDTAVVGAVKDDVGGNPDQGAAYVFVRSDAGTWHLQVKLTSDDGLSGDNFGSAVALSGNTLLVGAPQSAASPAGDRGCTYVFTRSGTAWSQQARLEATDDVAFSRFGEAVALDADTAVIGAWSDGSFPGDTERGSAYVFVRVGGSWTQQAKLIATQARAYDRFGFSVAIDGDTLVAGAPYNESGTDGLDGSAYVFARNGSAWTQQARLRAQGMAQVELFGTAVAISGESVLVGSPLDDVGGVARGSAYVFGRSGSQWTQQSRLTATDGQAGDQFGAAVSLAGEMALVGSHWDNGIGTDQGSAYVFARAGASWIERAKLVDSVGQAGDEYGASVAISGNSAIVGVRFDDVRFNQDQGSSAIFEQSGGAWIQRTALDAGAGHPEASFGWSVATSGDSVVVGSYLDDVGLNMDQGSVFVFVRVGAQLMLQAKLFPGDGAFGDHFGRSVAIEGETLVVGSPAANLGAQSDQGAVYVFRRQDGVWNQEAKLTAADGNSGDRFGTSVAVSGGRLVIGALAADISPSFQQGAAYVFVRAEGGWMQETRLVAADGSAGDAFGVSVATSGDSVLVGSSLDDIGLNINQGSAYVFRRKAGAWSQEAKLSVAGATGDYFGGAVAISGERALVGSDGDDAERGAAYVFSRNGTQWMAESQLGAPERTPGDLFGKSVVLEGDFAAIGAPRHRTAGAVPTALVFTFQRVAGQWTRGAPIEGEALRTGDDFGHALALSDGDLLIGAPLFDGPPPFGNPSDGAAYIVEDGQAGLFADGFE